MTTITADHEKAEVPYNASAVNGTTPKGEKAYLDGNVDVVAAGDGQIVDAVFGEITEGGPDYRGLSGIGAFIVMTKANIGLGVLSIPFIFQIFGIVPGIILLIVVQVLVMYSAQEILPFKLRHPEVYDISDAGYVFGGRIAREYLYIWFIVDMTTTGSGAIVSLSACLNAISSHGACTAVFIAVAAIAGMSLASIQTLSKVSWIGWVGLISLVASVLTVTIATGVQDRPAAAPQAPEPWDKDFQVVNHPSFQKAMSCINQILFAYSATPSYFNIVSEMADPRTYRRSLFISMTGLTVIYIVIGSLMYWFCGQYVATPALASAGALMTKVSYGIAIPALLATLVIYVHLASKTIMVRLLSGSRHLTNNSPTHWASWIGCLAFITIFAYIVASAVPNFGNIISLMGALLSPNNCFIPYAFMWWHDNWRYATAEERAQPRRIIKLCTHIFLLIVAFLITSAGTWAAVVDVINSSSKAGPWSCADNQRDG
ncbi:hypothetical protein Q8F55_000564 [Vanrija albida]|uniref:Amino acid transporter transmembrane domain-containing protein n=1 Tax=Vanrija albida TaxID=181172 RepID=A0ABR3QEL0_9TREE